MTQPLYALGDIHGQFDMLQEALARTSVKTNCLLSALYTKKGTFTESTKVKSLKNRKSQQFTSAQSALGL